MLFEMPYYIWTVHPNYKDDRPNPEQSEIIASFKETAKQSATAKLKKLGLTDDEIAAFLT